jgi:hypothetical protein
MGKCSIEYHADRQEGPPLMTSRCER